MNQAFSNIISNSLESIGNDGSIWVKLQKNDSGNVIIKFTDSGKGFDKETIDKVFDPYFTTKADGTGLGLSICHRRLMAHGAKIEVSNHSKGGAVVEIIFPITLLKFRPI